MKITDLLNEESKKRWVGVEDEEIIGIYEKFTGKKWEPKKKPESSIENLQFIDKFMKEKPNSGR